MHQTSDPDGRKIDIMRGLTGESEAQAMQVTTDWEQLTPEALMECLDTIFMPLSQPWPRWSSANIRSQQMSWPSHT
ncbi:MAG: hypothetical protein GY696_27680 [Gammaproteobacteria bacterium]|nr:hypothetical protein [Gammaproteobacteria bacterium]